MGAESIAYLIEREVSRRRRDVGLRRRHRRRRRRHRLRGLDGLRGRRRHRCGAGGSDGSQDRRGRSWRGWRDPGALEAGQPLVERLDAVVELRPNQAHERDFDHGDLLWRALHLSHRPSKGLQNPYGARQPEALSPAAEAFAVLIDRVGDLGRHLEQEDLTDFAGEALGELLGVPALARQLGQGRRTPTASESASAANRPSNTGSVSWTAPVATSWSNALRASRADPRPSRTAASRVVLVGRQAGGRADVVQQRAQRLAIEQPELQVLGPRADRGQNLVRVRRGQDEHDVTRGLFERLEQGSRRGLGELVDLVEDVDLPAPRGLVPRTGGDLADVVNAVVGGRVELGDVERGPARDRHATRALVARVAVNGVLTVQRLGEHARRRRLAGAAGSREEIGVHDAPVLDGPLERAYDVVLAADLGEATGPKAPIQRGDALG